MAVLCIFDRKIIRMSRGRNERKVKVIQSYPILCDSMNCSPPGSSDHGILQARILEWVAIPFSKGSSQPRIKPRSVALQVDSLPSEPPGKPGGRHTRAIMLDQGLMTRRVWGPQHRVKKIREVTMIIHCCIALFIHWKVMITWPCVRGCSRCCGYRSG